MKDTFLRRRTGVGRMLLLAAGGAVTTSALAPACASKSDPLYGVSGGGSSFAGSTAASSGAGGRGVGATGNESGSGNAAANGGSTTIVVEPNGGGGADDAGAAGMSAAAGSAELGRDDACALSTDTVQARPAVLELVIDTSGSMDWPPGWAPVTPDDSKPPGATKWEITRDALSEAVDSLDGDVALGANFYPNTTDDDDESVCLRNDVALPIARLGGATSAARASFPQALEVVIPNGATPTEGGYRFGLEQLAKTKLTGNKFLLLITDGTPTCTLDCECTEDNLPVDSDPLIEDAANALDDGVHTFVIGSPGSEDTREVLSALASAGGTAKAGCSNDGPDFCHLDMTTEQDLAAGLADALEQVALGLRSCEYPVPAAPDDQTLDPGRVNVLYTPNGGKTQTIPRDAGTSCVDGWQYTGDKESIVLCGSACERAKADVGAKVEVLVGCQTVIREPR